MDGVKADKTTRRCRVNLRRSDPWTDTAGVIVSTLCVHEKMPPRKGCKSTRMKRSMAKEHVLEHFKKKISIVGFAKLGKLLSLTAVRLITGEPLHKLNN